MQNTKAVSKLLTLKLHLILDNKSLILVVNRLGELGRDSVVSGGVLDNKTLIALDTFDLERLLDRPLADVSPFLRVFVGAGHVLLRMGRLPPGLPVIGELLEEIGLNGGGLQKQARSVDVPAGGQIMHANSLGCRCSLDSQ